MALGLVLIGAWGASFAALATIHCGGFTPVSSFVKAIGLHLLVRTDVAIPLVYGFLVLTLAGCLLGMRRHRRPHAVFLAAFGAATIVYTWHTGMETSRWMTFAFSGVLLTFSVPLVELLLRRPLPPTGCATASNAAEF